jgi:choline dehydrogenase
MAADEGFDVVVVGAGSAGCVVAARVATSGSRSVMLIEAGPDSRAHVPEVLRDGWKITLGERDWGYRSEPDARGDAKNVSRGKLFGGTSWRTRFATRGVPADYDEWATLGNEGWGFSDVLPYFTRLEADLDFGAQPWHGDSGPMPVNRYLDLEPTQIAAAGLDVLHELGFPALDDLNRPGAVGAGRMPMTSIGGRRVTTADAYLGAVPPNLTIRCDTQVGEILFDGNRASGVRLIGGQTIAASTVVLCAGVYANPCLLMRSGIGPPDHLRALRIPVRCNLPGVGENLADHPAIRIGCGYAGTARLRQEVIDFSATWHSSAAPTAAPPDLMLWGADATDEGTFDIKALLLKPHARGRVRLRSPDPAAAPLIELPVPDEQADLDRLAEAHQRALEFAAHPQIRRHCSGDITAGPSGRADLLAWIRTESWSIPHAAGTCAMGVRPEDGAVVDAGGRVHGTERLSVIDASIMPTVPSGFTHLPTIMIAERLVASIAGTY